MPFDSFFSSSNKLHYVRSENYENTIKPEVDRILALPKFERIKVINALYVKRSKRELTMTEKHVLKRLSFIWHRKHVAIQHRLHWKREKALRKKGMAFFGGYNTT